MKTRKDYMDKRCTHPQYYGQFVDEHIMRAVLQRVTLAQLLESGAWPFNDIPLDKWDCMLIIDHKGSLHKTMHRECGDYLTLGNAVCIVKEAARQMVQQVHAYNQGKADGLDTRNAAPALIRFSEMEKICYRAGWNIARKRRLVHCMSTEEIRTLNTLCKLGIIKRREQT